MTQEEIRVTIYRQRCAWSGFLAVAFCYLVLGIAASPIAITGVGAIFLNGALLLSHLVAVAALVLGAIGNRYVVGWIAMIGAVFWPLLFYCLRFL